MLMSIIIKATIGRDLEPATRGGARMVTWASDEEIGEVRRVAKHPPPHLLLDPNSTTCRMSSAATWRASGDRLEKLVRASQELEGGASTRRPVQGQVAPGAPVHSPQGL